MSAGRTELFLDVASDLLGRGHNVRFRAEGGSMHPAIRGGEAVVIEPVRPGQIRKDDILLYRTGQRAIAHRVVEIDAHSGTAPVFTLRGDAAGSSDERVDASQVLGRVAAVERSGWGARLRGLLRVARDCRSFTAIPIAVLACLCLQAAPAQAATKTWVPTAGGVWTTGANWSPAGAPAANDDVIINSDQTANITAVPTITLNSLTVSGNSTLAAAASGNTITVTTTLSISAGKTLTMGITGGRLVFTLNGTGTVAGNFAFDAGTTVRNFTVNGTLIVSPGGRVYDPALSAGSVFILNAGATLKIGNTGGISTGIAADATVAINFGGSYTYSAAANYEYNGTAAQVTGPAATNGLPTNLTGALTINNAAGVTLNAAKSIGNGGTVNLTAGTFATGTNLTMATTSSINVTGGAMTGTLQGAGTYNVTYSGGSTTTGGELSGAGLNNVTVSLTPANSVLTQGSNVTAAGLLTVNSNSVFNQACSFNLSVGRMSLTGNGNYTNCTGTDAGGTGTLTFTSATTPELTLAAGSRFDYVGTGAMTFRGAGATTNVSNAGIIRINGGDNKCNSGQVTITVSNATANRWATGAGTFNLSDVNLLNQVSNGGAPVPYGNSVVGAGSSGWGAVSANCGVSATLVRLQSFSATPTANGNRIGLLTSRDVNNLGFNVYREANGQLVKLNASLLAGSALMGGAGTSFTAGQSRRWLDREGSAGALYWLEEVDLSGARAWYGPAVAGGSGFNGKAMVAGLGSTEMLKASGASTAPAGAIDEDLAHAPMLGRVGAVSGANANIVPLEATVIAKASPQGIQKQFDLAAGPAVRLGVKAQGWYRVTQPQLVAAGIGANVDPRTLQLYVNGVEQPIFVEHESENRNRLQPQDAISFYGAGIDTTWSDTQVYWLVAGPGKGLRMDVSAETRGAAPAASFPATVVWKPRTLYFPALTNGDADNFFGPVVMDTPVAQALTVSRLNAAGGASTLRVKLQGVSDGAHAVTVALNGSTLGTAYLSGQGSVVASFAVPAVFERANMLTLGSAGADDVSLVDEVQLTYPHLYSAEDDVLRFTAPARAATRIDGFSTSSVTVVDVTDPANPSLVEGQVGGSAPNYSVTIVPVAGSGMRTLLAVASTRIQAPAIRANVRSSWHAPQAGYSMVILGHKSLLASAAPLVALRQSQGHKVALIDVEDLYDEFNFGVKSPYALRAFLANANARWLTKPRFVLLLGNGTFDPRNYLDTGVPDLVPTKLVDTQMLETASDDWFVDFDDDGIPDMAIGRLPAESVAQANLMVGRTVAYAQASTAPWTTRALLVSGEDKNPGDDFAGQSAIVQARLPGFISATDIVQSSDPNSGGSLLTGINAGQALVNYLGHGSVEVWAGGLFDSAAALSLANGAMTPVVLSMTCLNGYFQDLFTTALGKALLNAPGGGAVAVWASSGLTAPDPQSPMNRAMVEALYGTPTMTLGQAAAAAKASTTDMDVRRTWILLGDPSIVIH